MKIKKPRFKLCLAIALIGFAIAPYLSNLLPGGGATEQRWLDKQMTYIENKLSVCEDPEMQVALRHALKYNKIGRFKVRVMQLPEGTWGYNMPTCPGITLDEEVMSLPTPMGAWIIVHEGMHDFAFPPSFFHYHIDDEQILESLY